ncbi:MAG: FAD-dependent oxidoreductase [Acidimicrobiales bacterium]|nr:FAD-dependent oxidoreductase [Acidimicrobiales bacterium]
MPERLVVVGGDAAGMSAASQARRLRSDLEIIALERGSWTSYAACGIPYLVGGEVPALESLVARTPQEFRDRQRIDVRLRHEVMAVDLDRRRVEVRDHEHGRTITIPFDQLLVATGGRPLRPPLPGIDGPDVYGVQTLDDAATLLARIEAADIRRVVVVGGGYIGLEMAEAFVRRGAAVTVVEAAPEVMRTLDPEMGALVTRAMRALGIEVRLDEAVQGFEPGVVHAAGGTLAADVVVLGLGVGPNAALAADAGLALGPRGSVSVDRRQRTSAEGVWAAGDCAESLHLVSGRKVHVALGTVANKQGRVAGINLGGGYATFPGVLGTAVSKICATEVSRTGLGEHEAREAGFEPVTATITAGTRAHYYPGATPITVKVVAERGTGRLLGAQIVGQEGAAKRIDVFATALTAGMDVYRLIDLDLSYAPPFAPVWDPVLTAARQAANAVDDAG